MVGEKGISKVLGVNVNGNVPDSAIIEASFVAEKNNLFVWIGENELFRDPFEVAMLILEHVSVPIGFSIVSPLRRSCDEIAERVKAVERRCEEVVIGVGPGRFRDRREALRITVECVRRLKDVTDVPVYCGCSSPRITEITSKIADGIIFNYCNPRYVSWISSFLSRDVVKVSIGPSLILPSEMEQDLLLACAIVSCSSPKFVEVFNVEGICRDLSVDFQMLIRERHNGKDLRMFEEFGRIEGHREFLLKNFSISGDVDEVSRRIGELLKVCDHVILGDPFFRDKNSLMSIPSLNLRVTAYY